jgi:2-polyprenyl-3-methyl-5-hydroxy-6-metoxy-1,4-benzoquinol methylase
MTNRIPHKNEVIQEAQQVADYVQSHENRMENHYSAFLTEFDHLGVTGRYLEIGSGPGFLAVYLARKYPDAHITAVEPSAEMISFSTSHAQDKGVADRVRFVRGSVDDSRFMEDLGQFDLVYSTFSLHHWENPRTAWRYLLKRVKKNGTLFVHDLKRVAWLYYLPVKNGLFESIRAAYKPDEIRDMLKGMGFRNPVIKTPFPYFWMSILVKN